MRSKCAVGEDRTDLRAKQIVHARIVSLASVPEDGQLRGDVRLALFKHASGLHIFASEADQFGRFGICMCMHPANTTRQGVCTQLQRHSEVFKLQVFGHIADKRP